MGTLTGLRLCILIRNKLHSCDLTIDTNTVNRNLKLCESNRKLTHVEKEEPYPNHPDRFDFWPQLMCENALTGRCYREVEWTGRANISLRYRGMSRRGDRENCRFGENDRSWSLDSFTEPLHRGFTVWSGSSVSLCSLQDGKKIRRPCSVFSQEREGLSEVV
ncbi:neoverrucotoxin subunit beta-like [Pseudochaenichthys georgianus]|uniref:neoverrucotoxin subunit beta-like n=1 Tax=Pseudochaenichthys georgianus TaxID=52239 RepID=UPI00146E8EE9|nr:neoverrucotoxin subunit beta-like [Pseudochaenichthys georgianus]